MEKQAGAKAHRLHPKRVVYRSKRALLEDMTGGRTSSHNYVNNSSQSAIGKKRTTIEDLRTLLTQVERSTLANSIQNNLLTTYPLENHSSQEADDDHLLIFL
uniref:Uncharacterized protein n=1 Tax=Steinernema glaseri TaxID=37863 RepID=A0A1I7ZSQ7_9BILA